MAKQAISEEHPKGITGIDSADDVYKWKTTDSNPKRIISHIDKIDNFQGLSVPILRFRSSLHGPTNNFDRTAKLFSDLISTTELRTKHDIACASVVTIISAENMKEVEELQLHKYGEVELFGVGYTKTKQSIVSPREQLTLCGLQHFPSGAAIIWGVELEEDQNHLFPEGEGKCPRTTSHLFSTTLIPTGEGTFDVEYILQIEIGSFPGWLTGPAVADAVKRMFAFADKGFKEGGELTNRLKALEESSKDIVTTGEKAEDTGKLDTEEEESVEGKEEHIPTIMEKDTVDVEKDNIQNPEEEEEEEGDIPTMIKEEILGKRARVKKFFKKLFRRGTPFDKYT